MRVAIAVVACWFAVAAQADDYPADAYATCSACHLADGAGVPGAFPPLRNRMAAIAALDGGREYLVTVVSFGLMGTISVDGMQYFGVMAGNGMLSAEEIAAALNYVVFVLNDGDAEDIEAFTAEEVEAIQSAVTVRSPAGGGELRQRLATEHGDAWP